MSIKRRDFINGISTCLASLYLDLNMPNLQQSPKYNLEVNVPQYKLHLLKGDQKIKTYEIAVGRPLNDKRYGDRRTPIGEFKIIGKASWENQFAGTWLRFIKTEHGGYGIHGYPHEWFVGHPLSQGCITLKPSEAEELKKNIEIGTNLNIFYDTIDIDKNKNLITFYSDIYSMGTNNHKNLIKKLQVSSIDDLNKTNLLDILFTVDDYTKTHLNTTIELCTKFIEPRPNGTIVTLLDDYPEVQGYLDKMNKYKKLTVSITDLL